MKKIKTTNEGQEKAPNAWVKFSERLPEKSGKYILIDKEAAVPIIDFILPGKQARHLADYYTHWQYIILP